MRVDRTSSWELPDEADAEADDAATDRSATLLRRVMPLPSKRERRLELRLRANELIELLEGTDAADPEATDARAGYEARLAEIGRSAGMAADAARAAGLDPLTLRHVAGDGGAGANLLEVAALPEQVQLLVARHLRALPAAVRLPLRLQDPAAGPAGGRIRVRERRPRGVRGVHPRAARAAGARRGAAHPRGPGAPLPRAVGAHRLRRQAHGGGVPAPGDGPAGQLLDRRGEQHRPGDRGGAGASTW